jgi:hypothetical protein
LAFSSVSRLPMFRIRIQIRLRNRIILSSSKNKTYPNLLFCDFFWTFLSLKSM